MTTQPGTVDQTYAFTYALTDLVDVMAVDLLPPPLNIGWRTEHGDTLVVQVAGTDALQWLRSIDFEDGSETRHRATALIVQVTGRLAGTKTPIVLLYDRVPPSSEPSQTLGKVWC